jgi:hypothetical protein
MDATMIWRAVLALPMAELRYGSHRCDTTFLDETP